MRYLGIDYGTKKVGLAFSDEKGTMGFPHAVVPTTKHLADNLAALIKEKGVAAVVIGESLSGSGEENPVAKEARAFGARLKDLAGVPVKYEMEAFTTQEARRDIEGVRGHGEVDASAAALILTSYLSRSHDND